jgi:hypothetical protein
MEAHRLVVELGVRQRRARAREVAAAAVDWQIGGLSCGGRGLVSCVLIWACGSHWSPAGIERRDAGEVICVG